MPIIPAVLTVLLLLVPGGVPAAEPEDREILVTFDNSGAKAASAGAGAPYRHRKRYAVSLRARQSARQIAAEYSLEEIDDYVDDYAITKAAATGDPRHYNLANLEMELGRLERLERAHEGRLFEAYRLCHVRLIFSCRTFVGICLRDRRYRQFFVSR